MTPDQGYELAKYETHGYYVAMGVLGADRRKVKPLEDWEITASVHLSHGDYKAPMVRRGPLEVLMFAEAMLGAGHDFGEFPPDEREMTACGASRLIWC